MTADRSTPGAALLTDADREALWGHASQRSFIAAVERILADHVRRARAEALMEFAQWVATNRSYNGSDHRHGQSLYNECLNAVLPTWASEFAIETEETP